MLGAVEREGGYVVGVGGITDETSSGMGVKTDHEEESEVVGVPERLKALLPNFC